MEKNVQVMHWTDEARVYEPVLDDFFNHHCEIQGWRMSPDGRDDINSFVVFFTNDARLYNTNEYVAQHSSHDWCSEFLVFREARNSHRLVNLKSWDTPLIEQALWR